MSVNIDLNGLREDAWVRLKDAFQELLREIIVWGEQSYLLQEERKASLGWDQIWEELHDYSLEDQLRRRPEVSETTVGPRLPEEITSCIQLSAAALKTKDKSELKHQMERLQLLCMESEIAVNEYLSQIDEQIELLDITETRVIYTPPEPAIYIPELIITVQETLLQRIKEKPNLLYELPSRSFEELIAELFWKNGFEVELTKKTRDGGRDIIALHKTMGVLTKFIIECKRYSAENKVSLALVQRLFGVKIAEQANKAILATTSTFTRDARQFASMHMWDLELKDRDDILCWIKNTHT